MKQVDKTPVRTNYSRQKGPQNEQEISLRTGDDCGGCRGNGRHRPRPDHSRYADTGNGTVATLALKVKRPVGPGHRLEQAIVRIVKEIFRPPVRKQPAQKAE
jgi:hypothetical protein